MITELPWYVVQLSICLGCMQSEAFNVHLHVGSKIRFTTWSLSGVRISCQCVFAGISAYDNWTYCVNYTTVEESANTYSCTHDLNITLRSLENDTFYQFNINAIGPGGERTSPYVTVFRTKPTGKM